MDFNYKNFGHLFAAVLVLLTLLVFIILPVVSLLFPIADVETVSEMGELQGGAAVLFEIILLIMQIIIAIFLLVLIPFIWYRLVNNYSIKEILQSIQLKKENLTMAFLWGILTAVIALGMVLIISAILSGLGVADENASNIQDLEQFFSVPTILFLIITQPIAEEIFFRGFLLDKFTKTIGTYPAIITTSALFGVAHISMGNVIPAIIITIVALVFAYMVVKTKNLMTAIIGHIIFNVISFILYLIGQQILTEGLIF